MKKGNIIVGRALLNSKNSHMNLTPETVSAYRDILANPTKHNLPFPSFRDLFLPSDYAIAKHIAHDKYEKIIDRNIPKVIFYILLDEIFPQKKDSAGNLGWCFKFADGFGNDA